MKSNNAAAVPLSTALLTVVAMVCFAANSILTRLALRGGEIDGGTFTGVRILSGAAALMLLARLRGERFSSLKKHGSLTASIALFTYAVVFSFAYLWLDAGVGALILFAAVQITMIGVGVFRGERPRQAEWLGLVVAIAGLVYLVFPGLSAPPPVGALLMTAAGVAWGFYSLEARGARSPITATASNFARAVPLAAAVLVAVGMLGRIRASTTGVGLAMMSGAVTSGLGYAIWYMAARNLTASRAAIVQLTVPGLAALAAVLFLGETLTGRLVLAGGVILAGVALALLGTRSR